MTDTHTPEIGFKMTIGQEANIDQDLIDIPDQGQEIDTQGHIQGVEGIQNQGLDQDLKENLLKGVQVIIQKGRIMKNHDQEREKEINTQDQGQGLSQRQFLKTGVYARFPNKNVLSRGVFQEVDQPLDHLVDDQIRKRSTNIKRARNILDQTKVVIRLPQMVK